MTEAATIEKTKDAKKAAELPLGRGVLPLRALVKSQHRNVRKVKRTKASVRTLADQIKGQNGLLQNLVVFAQRKKGKFTGVYEVSAGEGRLEALWMLRDDDKWISDDYPVDVLVIAEEVAIAASLAENLAREPMHPADEFEAFKQMVDDGFAVEDIAARFGTEPKVVQRRLKLASVAPALLALYRGDGMKLDQLMAFTLVDDQDQQVKVWESLPKHSRSHYEIRNALMGSRLPMSNKLVRFVGVETYREAGGVIYEDLFAQNGQDGYIEDAALITQLANDKLEATASQYRAQGWAWVEVNAKLQSHEANQFGRAPSKKRALSDEEKDRLKVLNAEKDGLDAKIQDFYDNDDDDSSEAVDVDALEERSSAIDDEIGAIEKGREFWSKKLMATSGVIVSIDHNGDLAVYAGLVRKTDERAARAVMQQSQGSTDDDGGEGEEQGDSTNTLQAYKISDALHCRLTAQHTAAVQWAVASHVPMALRVLAEKMARRVFYSGYETQSVGVSLTMAEFELKKHDESIHQAPAMIELMTLKDQWAERMPKIEAYDKDEKGVLFTWICDLEQDDVLSLIALCTALTINLVDNRKANPNTAKLAGALNLNMADWWEPTAANYLSSVPKEMIVEAVKEGVGAEACEGLDKLKKGAMAEKAETLLKGTGWLPAVMRV